MKLLFTSDLHSDIEAFERFTSLLKDQFDLGVISGDLLDDGISIGSKCISEFLNTRNVKLHLFGHVHESFGMTANAINGAYPLYKKMVGIDLMTADAFCID